MYNSLGSSYANASGMYKGGFTALEHVVHERWNVG